MTRLPLVAILLAQAAAPVSTPGEPALVDLATKAGLAGLVLFLWREDRKSREAQQQRSDERHENLVQETTGRMLAVIEGNGKIIQQLLDSLQDKILDCPYRDKAKRGSD